MIQSNGGRVVMWRRDLLPGSETFVRSQLEALPSWHGMALGAVKVSSPISKPSDEILFSNSRFDQISIRLFNWMQYSPRLHRRLKELKPDVVHAHFAMDCILVAPICQLLRIPYVVSVYGVDVTAMAARSGLRGRIYRRRLASMFRNSSKILAVSDHLAESAIRLGAPRQKVIVHRLGIEIPAEAAEALDDIPNTEWDVLVVGRLVEKKGIDDLIEAAALVNRSNKQRLRVAVIGDGPLRQELEDRASRLGTSVDFLGELSPSKVKDVMRRSHILAVPSKAAHNGDREGLPMILLEGAALGLPLVATRHSGIPEFVTHNVTGLLSDERDVQSLADNISRLLEDEQFGALLAQEALRRVTKEYNINTQAELLEGIYDKAVKG